MTVPSAEHRQLRSLQAAGPELDVQPHSQPAGGDARRSTRHASGPGCRPRSGRRTVCDRRPRLPRRTVLRDWGLCDKRAKAYATGGGPGKTEAAVASYRVGLDGLPVVYRFKAEPTKKYLVYLVVDAAHRRPFARATGEARRPRVRVPGRRAAPQTLDWIEYLRRSNSNLCASVRWCSRRGRRRIHRGVVRRVREIRASGTRG